MEWTGRTNKKMSWNGKTPKFAFQSFLPSQNIARGLSSLFSRSSCDQEFAYFQNRAFELKADPPKKRPLGDFTLFGSSQSEFVQPQNRVFELPGTLLKNKVQDQRLYFALEGSPMQWWKQRRPYFEASGVLVYDTYTGADGTNLNGRLPDIGPAPVPISGTWAITSNQAYLVSPGAHQLICYDVGVADCTILCTFDSNGDERGIAWRAVDDGNYWFFRTLSGGTELYEKTSGGFTQRSSGLATASATPVTWKVVLLGTSMTIYEETSPSTFTKRMSYTSSVRQSATKHGPKAIIGGTGNERFDNFKIMLNTIHGATALASASSQYYSRSYIPLDGSIGFSVCFWLYVPIGAFAGNAYLINGPGIYSGATLDIGTQGAGNTYILVALADSAGSVALLQLTSSLTLDTWHHVAVWYDPSDKKVRAKLDNGTTVASTALPTNPNINSSIFKLGVADCRIANARVWSHTLSLSDIAADYNSGTGLTYSQLTSDLRNSLVANYFEDSSLTADKSGNSNTLTAFNSPTLVAGPP